LTVKEAVSSCELLWPRNDWLPDSTNETASVSCAFCIWPIEGRYVIVCPQTLSRSGATLHHKPDSTRFCSVITPQTACIIPQTHTVMSRADHREMFADLAKCSPVSDHPCKTRGYSPDLNAYETKLRQHNQHASITLSQMSHCDVVQTDGVRSRPRCIITPHADTAEISTFIPQQCKQNEQ
jgi:hypothetical protein